MSVRSLACTVLAAGLISTSIAPAAAFCGFYVGKADAGLFNQASQVILVRDGNRTVISMLNDYKGSLDEFALVVPVPQVLQREQIHVGDKKLFEHIDAYSAPRLAEYHDENPCMRRKYELELRGLAAPAREAGLVEGVVAVARATSAGNQAEGNCNSQRLRRRGSGARSEKR